MFKNSIIYRITALPIDALGADDALQDHTFTPCGASQEKSIGWTPPRGELRKLIPDLLDALGGEAMA